jgi:DegV family protein with EDD domain
MAASSALPSTAAPSPGLFEKTFRELATDDAQAVVCINLSSKLSATYQAAINGADMAKDAVDVRVVDSTFCATAQATLCRRAVELAATGATADEVVDGVNAMLSQLQMFGTLDSLDNLRKGGRIGAAGAFFASLLSVKPIIKIVDGEVQPDSRQRTRTRALQFLAQRVIENGPVTNVSVAHSGAPDIEQFVKLLDPVATREEITISEIGPTIGTHGGPRLIAVSFTKE